MSDTAAAAGPFAFLEGINNANTLVQQVPEVARRAAIVGIGLLFVIAGLLFVVAGSKAGKTVVGLAEFAAAPEAKGAAAVAGAVGGD